MTAMPLLLQGSLHASHADVQAAYRAILAQPSEGHLAWFDLAHAPSECAGSSTLDPRPLPAAYLAPCGSHHDLRPAISEPLDPLPLAIGGSRHPSLAMGARVQPPPAPPERITQTSGTPKLGATRPSARCGPAGRAHRGLRTGLATAAGALAQGWLRPLVHGALPAALPGCR